MHLLFRTFIGITLALVLIPSTASASFTITGTVNGGNITTATTREAALQVPFSKPFFVQGSVVNNSDDTVHLVKVTVKPDIMFFPTLEFEADSQMGAQQSRSTERTITFNTLVEKYVPKMFSSWLVRTTAKVTVKAYQQGNAAPIAQQTLWVHIGDDVEVVPQSAIAAIGQSPLAQAGLGIAGVSTIAAGANIARRRKKPGKGKGVGAAAITSIGMSIGTALTLFAIGAIDFLELMAVDAGAAAAGAGILYFLGQVLMPK